MANTRTVVVTNNKITLGDNGNQADRKISKIRAF